MPLVVAVIASSAHAGDGEIVRFPDRVPGRYIVMLQHTVLPDQVPELARQLAEEHDGRVRFVMNNVVNLFSVEMTDARAQALARHPLVLQVDEVAKVRQSSVQSLPPPAPLNWMDLWNLDRLDQESPVGDGQYRYCNRATGVIAYVVDSGVMGDHDEFDNDQGASRVKRGACFAADCVEDRGDTICPFGGGRSADFTIGHGTSVASIIAGRTVGVAKDVTIVPIRIWSCFGDSTTEDLIRGLDWIRSTSNPDAHNRPALINVSGYVATTDPDVTALEQVISGLVLDNLNPNPQVFWLGIPFITLANNQGSDTCVTSPARMAYRNAAAFPGSARVISVGGSARVNDTDVRWQCPMLPGEPCWPAQCTSTSPEVDYGSNHGNMVDIYAPAHHVESAHTPQTDAYRRDSGFWDIDNYASKSGTSFAAPLAAGVAARILEQQPSLKPDQLWNTLRGLAHEVPTPFDATGNNLLLSRRYSDGVCP